LFLCKIYYFIIQKQSLQTLLEKKEFSSTSIDPTLLKNKCGVFKSIISSDTNNIRENKSVANIILHLKCSLKDLNEYNNNTKTNKIVKDPLEYDPSIPSNIFTYEYENRNVQYSFYAEKDNILNTSIPETNEECNVNNSEKSSYSEVSSNVERKIAYTLTSSSSQVPYKNMSKEYDDENISIKDINQKLKNLKINFYKNNIQDKKSACFWCTYDYDNVSCYIPKHEIDGTLYGYGSFCRPECAVAFLMKENIDDSVKFERYQLLNQLYSKIYDFKKSIKPSPNPYYLLDKFYGNLTIQEYRKLLKTDNSLLFIEKPMTRILPELHEDNDNMSCGGGITGGISGNNQSAYTGVYKVKKQSDKKQEPTKSSIIRNNFNLH
jgi:hypothetical protein